MKRILHYILAVAVLCVGLTGCIEDGFETSPSAQPRFSADTLSLGVQFAERPSPTYTLTIHNPHSKQLLLSSVKMRSGEHFRINVDGAAGTDFSNVEIRPKDSIYVFVEGTFPPTGLLGEQNVLDYLDVTTNGQTRSVVVTAQCVDGVELRHHTVDSDVTFTADRPYLVTDTLFVAKDATLTLEAGASLLFHDRAALIVEGRLLSNGTAQAPVTMRGDRTGAVVADISFDVMANQWEGVRFLEESAGNALSHTNIVNTCQGVALDSLSELTLVNCRFTNSGSVLVTAYGANLTAVGSELSNGRDALLLASDSEIRIDRCTLANWYLFAYPSMAIVEMPYPETMRLDITNSVIYGRGMPVGFGAAEADALLQMPLTFRRCLFAVGGEDDANFVNCLWDEDPKLDYSLTDYVFTYTPQTDSPVLGASDPALNHPLLPELDPRGLPRGLTLGCYAPEPQ